MAASTVYEAFYPFSYLAIACGLEKINKVGSTYQIYSWSTYITIANAILIVVSCVVYYFEHETERISGVYYWSMLIFNWGTCLRLLSIHTMRILNRKCASELYANVDEYDKQMIALGKSAAITNANKKLRWFAIAAIPISALTYALSEVYTSAVGEDGLAFLVIASRFVGSYVGLLAKIQFYLWCTALTERFEMLNDLLMKMKERFQMNNMFVVSVYKYEQCIDKYGDLHRELTQLARQMNDMYQFDMLWHFFIMFVVTFTNAYFSTFMFVNQDQELNYFAMSSNFLFIMFEIILTIKPSTDLCNESYKALDVFNNLKVDPDDTSVQRLVISAIFELKENRLEITACRFFNINFSTLAVMSTIIANYVFIMIQFEEGNNKDTNATVTTALSTISN